ncbi:MAG TPA: hypothetical protein VEX18_08825, partial [Polyangiaceae bacterium]|nr:hypothetical protein [Polyangiaceae bacterium]
MTGRFVLVLSGTLLALGCSDTPPGPPAGGSAGSGSAGGGAGGAPIQAGGTATAGSSVGGATGGGGGIGTSGAGTSGAGSGGTVAQGGSAGQPNAPDVAFCTTALDAAALQLAGFRAAYTTPASIPRSATTGGDVRLVGPGDWTSGFVAGSLWLIY